MKHIKKFTEVNTINEYYGGPLKDLMGPRAEELMEFLQSYKENIDSASQEDHDKVEAMYRLLSLIKKSVLDTDFLIKLFLFLGYKNKKLNGITKYTKNYICNCLST